MLFCGRTGHWLKPVRKVRCALLNRPFFHGVGNDIGRLGIEGFVLVDRLHQFFINIFGELFFDDGLIKGIFAKILRYGNKLFFFNNVLPFRRDGWFAFFHHFVILG